jgi:hypothetical protein
MEDKQKETREHPKGWVKSKRYNPPGVDTDYHAEWHTTGICNYLETKDGPQGLAAKLIAMIKKAGKLFSFLSL